MAVKLNNILGFTLIELLIVIAITAILGAITIPIGSSFLVRTHHSNKTNELVSALSTAQMNSVNGKDDSLWGVEVTANQIRMYAVNGNSAFDQTYQIPSSITINQDTVVFDKLTGNPDSVANFAITTNTGDTNTVSVNEVGAININ